MLFRYTAFLCALLASGTAKSNETKRLVLSDLTPGSRFEISTTDRVYRGEMIDPATGEARLAASMDGVRFSEAKTVFLLGSTQGRYPEAGGLMLVKMNTVQKGLCVELGMGSLDERDRFLTEPVSSIRVQ